METKQTYSMMKSKERENVREFENRKVTTKMKIFIYTHTDYLYSILLLFVTLFFWRNLFGFI